MHISIETKVGLNLNFEFESAIELLINLNLNFVFSKSMNLNLNLSFSKSMNLNLNFVFSTSMNLNILIKHSTNFEFFGLNLTKQMQQCVTGLCQLMLQTFHKILSSQQKVYDGKYEAARRFEVVFGHSSLPLLENGLYTQSLGFHIFKGFYSILIGSEDAENEIRLYVSSFCLFVNCSSCFLIKVMFFCNLYCHFCSSLHFYFILRIS